MSTEPLLTQHKVTVLLIDDQPMIGEAVRRMLAGEPDIAFHYCRDATKALDEATRIKPTVILQDLVMPDIDGLTLVKNFRANEGTRETPDDRALHQGRAGRQGRGVRPGRQRLHRQAARPARAPGADPLSLEGLHRPAPAQRGLPGPAGEPEAAGQRGEAGGQVRPVALPEKLKKGLIKTDWRFVPSAELGGDSFGYHWLDDDHFAFYLLDVSGHGVGAALLSVSAMNALRSQALPKTDFRQPSQVLFALNNAFQMDQQNGLYFTIWYGVYHKPTRRIDYSGGGHPPALLIGGPPPRQATLQILDSKGPMIGASPTWSTSRAAPRSTPSPRSTSSATAPTRSRRPTRRMWPFSEFLAFMGQGPHDGAETSKMDQLIAHDRS